MIPVPVTAQGFVLCYVLCHIISLDVAQVSHNNISSFKFAANIITVDEGLSGFSNEGVLTVLVSQCHF